MPLYDYVYGTADPASDELFAKARDGYPRIVIHTLYSGQTSLFPWRFARPGSCRKRRATAACKRKTSTAASRRILAHGARARD